MSARVKRATVLLAALAIALIQPQPAAAQDTLRVIVLSSDSYYPMVSNSSAADFIGT